MSRVDCRVVQRLPWAKRATCSNGHPWTPEGDLGSHDGDVPDFLAMLAGAYGPWLKEAEAAS